MPSRPIVNGHDESEPAARRPVSAAVGAGARVLPPPLVPALPSARNLATALGGKASGNSVRFPGPGRKSKDQSCTLTLDERAPDGFVVADAREEIPYSELKDFVRQKAGLPAFQPHSNGVRSRERKPDREGGGGPKKRLRLLPFNKIRLGAKRRDLVAGIIPRTGMTIIWGAPKSGKSFLTFDIVMHVALGWPYRDRKVSHGPVVYCALEGQSGIEARVEAWRQTHLAETTDPIPFFLQPVPFNLFRDCHQLIEAIAGQLGSTKPAAIVFDTLARSMDGSESDDRDMGNYIRAADEVREAFECAVIVVHHCGHGGDRPRGHSSLLGAADAVIGIKKEATGEIIATVEMLKDGTQGSCFSSRLEPVTVGTDEDGQEITSCVVSPAEASATVTRTKPTRLPPAAQIALDALKIAIAEGGEIPATCNHVPANTRTVSLALWSRYAYQRDPDSNPEARKKSFQRARQALQSRGLIGVWTSENGGEEEAQCWLI